METWDSSQIPVIIFVVIGYPMSTVCAKFYLKNSNCRRLHMPSGSAWVPVHMDQCLMPYDGKMFTEDRWNKKIQRGELLLPFHLFRLQSDDIPENIKWSISIAKLNDPSGIKSGGITSTPFSTLGGIYNSREVERPESVPHKQNHRMDSFDVYPASRIINIQRRGVFGISFPL